MGEEGYTTAMPSPSDRAALEASSELLREHLGEGSPELAALESGLERALDEGRDSWPALEVPAMAFLAHVVARLTAGADPLGALARLKGGELYLAFACAHGVAGALEAFESAHGAFVTRLLERAGAREAEDLRQLVHQKLFAGPEPRIGEYGGAGELRSWLRVTCTRLVVDASRKTRDAHVADQEARAAALPDPRRDPEAQYLEQHYGAEFRLAFERGVGALGGAERTVLRWHYVQRLNIDQIAAARGVHRATAARQLQRARESLLTATRKSLSEQLALPDNELDSVLRVVDSQLQVSVERLLGAELEPGAAPRGSAACGTE